MCRDVLQHMKHFGAHRVTTTSARFRLNGIERGECNETPRRSLRASVH